MNYHIHLESSFKAGDIVLLYDTVLDANMSVKLYYKWIGPYKIQTAILDKGTYTLKELDSTVQIGTITSNRIKHLHQQQGNFTKTYDVPSVINGTLSRIEEVIHQEEDEDQGVIFPKGGDDLDTIDIDEDLEQKTLYTWQARAREQEDV